MKLQTEHSPLSGALTFLPNSPLSITVHPIYLSLTKQDNQIIDCRLIFQVKLDVYKRIIDDGLFNLKPEVRSSLPVVEFLPADDIQIESSLKPDLLLYLAEQANINDVVTYILNLNKDQPNNPILYTENWLGLSVKQIQDSGEIGYRTLWSYITPTSLAFAVNSTSEISEGIVKFFSDWTQTILSPEIQGATFKTLEKITNFLIKLSMINMDEINQKIDTDFQVSPKQKQIFDAIIKFFQEEKWPFFQIEGQPTIKIPFQGENGKWTCYAVVREEREQFAFYSICPVNAPEDKRLAVAEFLTRANCGMVIGNFELDFSDGEISYKTSIDVEGDRLSAALIQRLVYANVSMMDEYLPGILSVIYGNLSPADAIAQIEEQVVRSPLV